MTTDQMIFQMVSGTGNAALPFVVIYVAIKQHFLQIEALEWRKVFGEEVLKLKHEHYSLHYKPREFVEKTGGEQ